jgi:hypothetical protein
MKALLAAPPRRSNHLGSIPCNTSPRRHTPAFPLHFASTHQFSFLDLNRLESAANRTNTSCRPSSPQTPPTHKTPALAWKTPLESHPYTMRRSIPFRMTSLRKTRGEGVNSHPFSPANATIPPSPMCELAARNPIRHSLSASDPSATLVPTQRANPASHCHPERSEGSAFFSDDAGTTFVRNIPTRRSSIFAFVVTSLPHCFVTSPFLLRNPIHFYVAP